MRKILGKLNVVERMTAVVIVLILVGIVTNKKKGGVVNEVQITDRDRALLINKYGQELGLIELGDSVVFQNSNDQQKVIGLTLEKITLSRGGKTTDFSWDELKNADVRIVNHSGATFSKNKPPS